MCHARTFDKELTPSIPESTSISLVNETTVSSCAAKGDPKVMSLSTITLSFRLIARYANTVPQLWARTTNGEFVFLLAFDIASKMIDKSFTVSSVSYMLFDQLNAFIAPTFSLIRLVQYGLFPSGSIAFKR